MSRLRKIPCALALLVGLVALAVALAPGAALAAPAKAPAPTKPAPARIADAKLSQAGRSLIVTVRSSTPLALGGLEPQPDTRRATATYLCLGMGAPAGGADERRVCLGGKHLRKRAGLLSVDETGKPLTKGTVGVTVKRPSPRKLIVALVPGEAGLSPQRYGWRVLASTGCEARLECAEALPVATAKPRVFRLRPVRAIGCTGGSAGLVTNGSRSRPVVALTFDDGPSEYTDKYLDVLKEEGNVPATFFEIGQEMPGREEVMRRILREGDEIGDHTENHVEYPGYGQIADAAAKIRAYTRFKPCLFRPPGGAQNEGVVQTAGSLGMRTITWDVDPRDWSLPGQGEIEANILGHAQNGSIILMHDGGGPRDETLAALPNVIDGLRARGFSFATVSELLGYRLIYRPYG